MSNPRYSFYVRISEASGNERTKKVTWRTLCTIAHSLMVNARFLEAYINFALMYMADHILPVLLIKDLINEDEKPTTPYKLVTGIKNSISHYIKW